MNQAEIRAKREDVKNRLREHDAGRKLIEAELLFIQHACTHPNAKETHDSGWGRMPSTDWNCPDCGKTKSY